MRVAVIGHTYVVDANRGKWNFLASRCDALRLFVPSRWPEPDFWTRSCEPSAKLDIRALDAWNAGYARRWFFPPVRLRQELTDFRPDIVHVEAEAGAAVALETAFMKQTGRMTQFVWENIPIVSGWRRALARRNFAALDHLFCGSTGAKETAQRDGYPGCASVVAQVGVDVDEADAATALRTVDENRYVVGFVGRMDAKKGVHILLDAFEKLGDEAADLVFLGDGPDRSVLRDVAAKSKVSQQIHFIDPVGHDAVASHLKSFDVLVLPSLTQPGWREQFGHVLIEAMACRVPVIGSRCGAIPEVIGDGGLVVEENDAIGLAQALARLKNAPDERNNWALSGRRRVEQFYSDDAVAMTLWETWASLLAR